MGVLSNMKNYIELYLAFFKNDAKIIRIKNEYFTFRYRGATYPGF